MWKKRIRCNVEICEIPSAQKEDAGAGRTGHTHSIPLHNHLARTAVTDPTHSIPLHNYLARTAVNSPVLAANAAGLSRWGESCRITGLQEVFTARSATSATHLHSSW